MPTSITFTLDAEISPELQACFDALLKLKSDLPGDIIDRLLSLRETPQQIVHFGNNTDSASGTREIRIVLKPTDSFRELVATITRDFL